MTDDERMDMERGKALAMALEAMRKLKQERTEATADFKARAEALQTEIERLTRDIITGQRELPLDLAGESALGSEGSHEKLGTETP